MNVSQQIEHWLTSHKNTLDSTQRPFVTLSYAQSWDGSITTRTGETLALSGTESTCLTHRLRSLHDGILVGIGTVLSDDPQLTVRHGDGPNPQPIVLDRRLRMSPTARLCRHEDKRCWVLTSLQSDDEHERTELGNHVEIITLEGDAGGRVNLEDALALLWKKGIRMLMVEGGSDVITAFLKAQLADALVVTIAPIIVGGYKAVGELGITRKCQLPHIAPLFTEKLGNDLIMWGDLHYPEPVEP